MQTGKIFTDRKAMPSEGRNGINRQLARAVYQATAASIGPADLDLSILHEPALHCHVARRTAPTDRDNGRMFAQQEDNLAVVAVATLLNQPLLEGQGRIEIDLAQQKCFQSGRGWF